MLRMVYPFLPAFGRGLGVSLEQLSFSLTLRSTAGIFSPLLASLADSRGRKTGMLFGLVIFTASMAAMILAPSYLTFTIVLFTSILGNFIFVPALQAYLGDRVSYQRRGMALALSELGWSVSFLAGVPLIGLLMTRFGWRAPFPVFAGLGVLAVICLSFIVPADPAPNIKRPGLFRNLKQVFTWGAPLAGLAMGAAISGSNEMVNLVFGVWLEEAFDMKIAALGATAAVIGFSELGAELLVSGLVDRLGKARAVALGLIANILSALALVGLGSSVVGAMLGLALFYITFEFTVVSSIPMMTEVLPQARATYMAVYVAMMSAGRGLSDLLAPHLYTLGKHVPLLESAPAGLAGMLIVSAAAIVINLVGLLAWRHARR